MSSRAALLSWHATRRRRGRPHVLFPSSFSFQVVLLLRAQGGRPQVRVAAQPGARRCLNSALDFDQGNSAFKACGTTYNNRHYLGWQVRPAAACRSHRENARAVHQSRANGLPAAAWPACLRIISCNPPPPTPPPTHTRLPGAPTPCAHVNTFHHCISPLPQNGNPLVPANNPTGRCIVYGEGAAAPVPLEIKVYDLLCVDKAFDYMWQDWM